MRASIKLPVCYFAFIAISFAAGAYRDARGRFSATLPAGWTSGEAGGMTRFVSGNAYTLVQFIAGGAADPRRVTQFTAQFGQQWRDYRRLQNGKAQLSGVEGAFAIYAGTNPKGVDAIVRAISAPFGNDAILILSSCPVAEWSAKKMDIEAIERGFSARAPSQPPVQAQAQVQPRGARQLPQGFSVTARSGASGQALTATFQGGRSARAAFSGIFKSIYPYFDSPPSLSAAVSDRQDQEVQGFFRAVYQGVPVRGLMLVTTANGVGHAGLLFDREDTFGRSYSTLSRQMIGSFPAERGGDGGGTVAAPRKVPPLQKVQLSDGSGWIGLAPGYRMTGAFKGTVDVVGPDGAILGLGSPNNVFVNPIGGVAPNMMNGPYRDPVRALPNFLDVSFNRALSRREATLKIIETSPQQMAGGQAAYIAYELSTAKLHYRYFGYFQCRPIDNTMWLFFASYVGAPVNVFPREFPIMLAIWQSWGISDALIRERMNAALQSMRDTFKIYQGVHDNQVRAGENAAAGWSQVIRGVTSIEDVVTKRRGDVDTRSVDDVLKVLNRDGDNYRQVPFNELVR
jgi:hypothetical protein